MHVRTGTSWWTTCTQLLLPANTYAGRNPTKDSCALGALFTAKPAEPNLSLQYSEG